MVIVAITFAAATPMLGGFVRGRQVDDSAVQLLAVIQWGRQQAMLEARPYRLNLNPTAGRYRLLVQQDDGQYGDVAHDFGRVFIAPNGVEFAWADTDIDWERGHNGIQFWPDGTVEPVAILVQSADGEGWLVQCPSPSEPFAIVRASEGGLP